MSNVYLRFSIYLAIVVGLAIVPFGMQKKDNKVVLHQDKVVKITIIKLPKKKKVKKVIKKTKPKLKPKPKPIPKLKPIVKKVIEQKPKPEPIKKEIKEVVSEDDIAQKKELAIAVAAKKTYYDTIYESIAEKKRYPKKARRYKQEGSVKISFKVLSDGTIIDLKLIKLSKYKSLNKAVKKLFKRLDKFPRPPSNLSFPLELSITINYKLKR